MNRNIEPQMYFVKENPDFNCMLESGRIERIAANRVVLCTITEFGLMNGHRMGALEYNSFIETQQVITGSFKEESEIFMKTIPLLFASITSANDVSIECTA